MKIKQQKEQAYKQMGMMAGALVDIKKTLQEAGTPKRKTQKQKHEIAQGNRTHKLTKEEEQEEQVDYRMRCR